MKMPECWICMDNPYGLVPIRNSDNYEIFYRCTCKNGVVWEGRVRSIANAMDPQWIAENNIKHWWSVYKNKPGAIDKLEQRGIPIEALGVQSMNPIAQAKFILSLCYKCLGCNQLEIPNFPGVRQCKNLREAKGIEEMGKGARTK